MMRRKQWISLVLIVCLLVTVCVTPVSAATISMKNDSPAQREAHIREHICNFLTGVAGYYAVANGKQLSVNDVKAAYNSIARMNSRSYDMSPLSPETLDLDLYFQMLAETNAYHYSCTPTSVREITTNHYRAHLFIDSIDVYEETGNPYYGSYYDTAICIQATCQVSFSISNGTRSIYAATAPDSYLYYIQAGDLDWQEIYVPHVEDVSFSGSILTHEVSATVYYNGFVDDSAQTGASIELVYENVGFEKNYNVNNINLAEFGF